MVAQNVPELLWKFHDGKEPYWQSSIEYYGRKLSYQIGLREGRWILVFAVGGTGLGVPGAEWGDVIGAFRGAEDHLRKIMADPAFRTEPGTLLQ